MTNARFLPAALILSVCATAASATTVERRTLAELAAFAERVVVATVDGVRSDFSPDRKTIWTEVTFADIDVRKGPAGDATLTLRMEGGAAGDFRLHVPGIPEFAPGERVVLFVWGNGRYRCPLVGWFQGCFRVATDPETGDEIVLDHAGRAVVSEANGVIRVAGVPVEEALRPFLTADTLPAESTRALEPAASGERAMTLDAFLERVAAYRDRRLPDPRAAAAPRSSPSPSAPPAAPLGVNSPPSRERHAPAARPAPKSEDER